MEKFLKYKKYIISFVLIIFLVIIGGIYYFYNIDNNIVEAKENMELEIVEEVDTNEKKEESTEEIVDVVPVVKEYFVDIKGAVNNPGVYKLNENNIVNDAINMAGGLNKYADTKCINLSKKIKDEMVIYVYTKSETWQILNSDKQKEKENNVVCDEVKNDASISESSTQETNETKVEEVTNTLVNINNDGIDKLTTLPGIGESKAKTIIEYRETNGNFKTIEDLKNVSGIGDSTFEKIKDLITV
ncbi:MAG: helix-hairpin-helix domain-containing protein [Bacilli bacterium]|nr:helix-hairpin-helix domain-containing protein [Bacilli bacterium]